MNVTFQFFDNNYKNAFYIVPKSLWNYDIEVEIDKIIIITCLNHRKRAIRYTRTDG